jgi:hypothetical protein
MSLSDRLARLEQTARRTRRPTGPRIVCTYPDSAAGHPSLNEANMTESQAAAYREKLAVRGEPAPLFIRWNDARYLDL